MTLEELAGGTAVFMQSGEIASLVKDRASFAPVASAFTPDHIVYAGSDPMFLETNTDINKAWKNHVEKNGVNPKIIAVQGHGIFGAAAGENAANYALDLFKDAIKVSVYTESFGGPIFMTRDKIDFINNWEVERFRASILIK
jgi:rhamnose utilization protein RhaD (predicted bifunctional aldolase and dehydrogenase)